MRSHLSCEKKVEADRAPSHLIHLLLLHSFQLSTLPFPLLSPLPPPSFPPPSPWLARGKPASLGGLAPLDLSNLVLPLQTSFHIRPWLPLHVYASCPVSLLSSPSAMGRPILRVCAVGGNAISAFLSWRLQATTSCDVTLVWKSGFEAVSQYGVSFKYVSAPVPGEDLFTHRISYRQIKSVR